MRLWQRCARHPGSRTPRVQRPLEEEKDERERERERERETARGRERERKKRERERERDRTTTRRITRHDPVPREENLTEEDWAIMRAVERCPVWRTIKSFNLREREELLAAICMILQEAVEGNTEKSTINTVEDFRNWAQRWGEDDDHAQLTLQNQWDNLLRHLMGITAAMEVWGPTNITDPGENSGGNGTRGTPCLQGNAGGASTPGTTAEVGQAARMRRHPRNSGSQLRHTVWEVPPVRLKDQLLKAWSTVEWEMPNEY